MSGRDGLLTIILLGQLNFLHTTDTHGWHGGHLQEPQYSADWGDYISFAQHLRKKADEDGSDLLLIETGDRVEGNGLYDASTPKGKYTFEIIKRQHMDVVTSGNHELYIRNTSVREYQEVVPDFEHSYIASNLDIHDPDAEGGGGNLVPLAPRYRRITTKNQGIRIIAFGFVFDFRGNANNTRVQRVEKTVQEQWFQDAVREEDVDLFLVAGHVPVRHTNEYDSVYKAIRSVRWDTPIVFFGGHTHIRDFRRWEKKAMGIESGRYMETLGFLSLSGVHSEKYESSESSATLRYGRRYIDSNLYSLHHHSGTSSSTFATQTGKNVSALIHAARSELKLDHTYGCAPRNFWLNRAPYPSPDSLLTLLDTQILPNALSSDKPQIVLSNSGALRFDIFKGPFTVDTTYLVSPFTSGFRMIPQVPYQAASQVLRVLNNEGPIPLHDLWAFVRGEGEWSHPQPNDLMPPLPSLAHRQTPSTGFRPGSPGWNDDQTPLRTDPDAAYPETHQGALLPGYTTIDDLGDDGDDTLHQPIQFYDAPACIGAHAGFDASAPHPAPPHVDLLYNVFIQDWVLLALRFLGQTYEAEDTRVALDGTTLTTVLSDWVAENWPCDESEGYL